MAKYTINIPNAEVDDLVEYLCKEYRYNQNKQEDETEVQFAKRHVLEPLKRGFVHWKMIRAMKAEDQSTGLNIE